jgi:hypothetical protein
MLQQQTIEPADHLTRITRPVVLLRDPVGCVV